MASKSKKNSKKQAKHYVPVKKTGKSSSAREKDAGGEKAYRAKEGTVRERTVDPKKQVRKEARKENRKVLLAQIFPYVFGVLTVFLAVCLFFPDVMGVFGRIIHDFFFGLFGCASYVLPVFCLGHALMWHKDVLKDRILLKFVSSVGSEILLAMLIHYAFSSSSDETIRRLDLAYHWTTGVSGAGGGTVGGFLGALAVTAFGRVGMLILTIAGLILLIMLFFGLTPRSLWLWVAYKIRLAREEKEKKETMS